jgi:hypothetical protein
MFRSATITHPVVVNDGKPFDATKAYADYYGDEDEIQVRLETEACAVAIATIDMNDIHMDDVRNLMHLLQWQLAKALNPPIKVTQAVLDAMEKVPSAMFYVGEYGSSLETKYPLKRSDETYYTIHNARQDDLFGTKLTLGDYIQADCPLALQVLLGFTTEGVPV